MIEELESKTLLIDYYDRVVGTPDSQAYYELVLYTYDDNHLLLEVYREGGTENEYVKAYKVNKNAYAEAIEIINDEKMHEWNKLKDAVAISGKSYVCKFLSKDGLIRVSSEHMPENGIKSFNSIKTYLESLIDNNNLEYEHYVNEDK